VTVETGTGRILTMAQNKTFDDTGNGDSLTTTAVNFNTDKDLGGSSGFQVGSTYKTFTLINWLEHNHGLDETVNGAPRTYKQSEFTDSCNGPYGGDYPLRNDSGRAYPLKVREAFAYSVNGAFVNMALSLDLCDTRKIAQALGMHMASGKKDGSDLDTQPSSVLGTASVAPLSVAAAYAAIANDGEYCTPIAVDKVVDSSGKDLGSEVSTCTQGIPEDVAVATQSGMLSAMATYQSDPKDGTEHIAKTGTTQDSTHTWVTASSSTAATSVWYGNISGKYAIRSYNGGGTYAGNQRHLIMKAILTKQDQLYPGEDFAQPDESLLNGVRVNVPSVAGMSESAARTKLRAAGFIVSDTASQAASDLPKGTVTGTTPSGSASKGSYITIYISDESQATVPDVTNSDLGSARSAVRDAGFKGDITEYCVAQGSVDPATGLLPDGSTPTPDGTVVEVAPDPGTVKAKDGLIRLGVAYATC
jgi:membrane peptidoglycan carboxypeptidase